MPVDLSDVPLIDTHEHLRPESERVQLGSDYLFIEGVYAHSVLMWQNISRVLEEKISAGWFKESDALDYARLIMYDNANNLYQL